MQVPTYLCKFSTNELKQKKIIMVTSLTFSTPFPIPTINRQCDIVDTCAISQSLGKCSIFQNLNDLAVESPVFFL